MIAKVIVKRFYPGKSQELPITYNCLKLEKNFCHDSESAVSHRLASSGVHSTHKLNIMCRLLCFSIDFDPTAYPTCRILSNSTVGATQSPLLGYVGVLTDNLSTNIYTAQSCIYTIQLSLRTFLHSYRETNAIYADIYTVSKLDNTICSICFCQLTCQNRSCLPFKGRLSPFSNLSHASTWLL